MTKEQAREKAAQAWCKDKTSNKVLDVDLVEAFAEIIMEVYQQGCNETINGIGMYM